MTTICMFITETMDPNITRRHIFKTINLLATCNQNQKNTYKSIVRKSCSTHTNFQIKPVHVKRNFEWWF